MPSRRKDRSLPRERQKTDQSLREERQKADQTLAAGTGRTEDRTDEHVQETREKTDETRRHQRAKVDRVVHDAQHGAAGSEATERVADELERERNAGDRALEEERRRVDTALGHERERRSDSVQQFLESERGATDRHLTHERESADEQVRRAVAGRSQDAAALTATRSALLTRDDFLAIIGHDLKNPLVAVATTADSLRSDASHLDISEKVRSQADVIATNARDALRLLNDLLERVAVWQEPGTQQGSNADTSH